MTSKCGNFELNAEGRINPPEDEDFNTKLSSIALQYGADFILQYSDNKKRKNPLGIIQFINSKILVGNQLGDSMRHIYVDSGKKDGIACLKEYLYGYPGVSITYENSSLLGQLMCERELNKSIVRDCPREIMKYDVNNGMSLEEMPTVEFYDFFVEIEGDYCIIYPNGVKWGYSVKQVKKEDKYVNKYDLVFTELSSANFQNLKLNSIFGSSIDVRSYKILVG